MSAPTDPLDIFARTLWGEVRGFPLRSIWAVACVITNRAKYPRWWGHDFASVCRAPKQFSCWNEDDPNLLKMLALVGNEQDWSNCLVIAWKGMNGKLQDITLNADHYYAWKSPTPVWADPTKHTVRIGPHDFYRLELRPPSPV